MKNAAGLVLTVGLLGILLGCTDAASGGETANTYAVGDTGPAGGLIFYDKGNDSGGWRYLESAPADLYANFGWGTTTVIGVTATAIGTGSQNTDAIIGVLGAAQPYAAHQCRLYSYGGCSDWFLPSRDEATEMLNALSLNGLGGFSTTASYWSSSEQSSAYAYYVATNGTTVASGYYDKTDFGFRMRPIRMF